MHTSTPYCPVCTESSPAWHTRAYSKASKQSTALSYQNFGEILMANTECTYSGIKRMLFFFPLRTLSSSSLVKDPSCLPGTLLLPFTSIELPVGKA